MRVRTLKWRAELEKELREYRLKQILSTGHVTYGPFRHGPKDAHDDLLFAVCLGCWAWERAMEKVEYISFPAEILLSS